MTSRVNPPFVHRAATADVEWNGSGMEWNSDVAERVRPSDTSIGLGSTIAVQTAYVALHPLGAPLSIERDKVVLGATRGPPFQQD